MTWSKDISKAPKTGRVILATKCEQVVRSNWIEKEKRWNGLAAKEQPIAWQPWPNHPYEEEFG